MIIGSPPGVTSIKKTGDSSLKGAVTLTGGTNVTLTQSGQDISIAASAGAATPAGLNTQVQFNDASSFGGDAGLTYDKTNDALTISGSSNSPTPVNGLLIQNTDTTTNNGAWLRLGINRTTPGQIVGAALGATLAGDTNNGELAIYTRNAGSLYEVGRFLGSGNVRTQTLGVAGGRTGILNLTRATSGTITIQPAAAAGTWTMTLPTDDGTANQFLQTDGAGVCTWATPAAGGTPTMAYYNSLSNSGETNQTLYGGGTATFNTTGLTLQTSATGTSGAKFIKYATNGQYAVFASNSNFSVIGKQNTAGTGGEVIFGVGRVTVTGSTITYTVNEYGFKVTANLATLSATNGNGTTETATASGAVTLSNAIMYHAKKTGTTDIKFYTDRTLQVTHTTNLPTGNSDFIGAGISNTTSAADSVWELCAYIYNQDAE